MKHKHILAVFTILSLRQLSCGRFGGTDAEPAPPGAAPGNAQTPEVSVITPETVMPTYFREATNLQVRPIDGMEMILIPAGEFLMGDDNSAFNPEKPAHLVTLDAYWIDRYEVKKQPISSMYGGCCLHRTWELVESRP